MTRILRNKSLLLVLFLTALGFSILYLSRGAEKVYSHAGRSTCGAGCGSSNCLLGFGCSGANPYRFDGWACFGTVQCSTASFHCHRCTFPSDCGNTCSPFSRCVASCGGAPPTPEPTPEPTPTPTPTPPPSLPCPTGFSVSCNLDGTQATVNWDDLAEAVRYIFRLNAFPTADWFNGAGGDQWLEPLSSFITVNVTPGLSHQYDIQGVRSGEVSPYSGCRAPFATFACTPPPSCTANLTPDTATISVGSSTTLTASVTIISGTVDRVDFLSGDTGIVTVSPASDSSVVYSTQATGVSIGSTTVSADVIMNGVPTCSDSAAVGAGTTVDVIDAGPWWQVIDADVTTNGDLISPIPGSCTLPACNPVFGLRGAGGFPGVPAYGGATADFLAGAGTGRAAEDPYNWLAASRYLGKIYDYAYFKKQIPDDVVFNELTPPVTGGTFNSGGAPSRGYIWYHWDGATLGDLTINGNVNLVGSRKVVLMVEGANTTINGKIQLQNPGLGFFMIVVGKDVNGLRGDIQLTDKVDNLEGIFLAESEFRTGVVSFPLQVRGSVVAYEGISLERDLGASNADTPAEVFEYAPDIIATFPQVFTQRKIRWKEVAP